MKNSVRLSALLLSCAVMLSACSTPAQETSGETEASVATTEPPVTAETTTTVTETEKAEEEKPEEEEPKEIQLRDLPERKYGMRDFGFTADNEHQLLSWSINLDDVCHRISGPNQLSFAAGDYTMLRESCNGGTTGKNSSGNILQRARAKEYEAGDYYKNLADREIYFEEPKVYFDSVTEKGVKVGAYETGYHIHGEFNVKAFVKYIRTDAHDSKHYEVIVDPAYMYNIPLLNHDLDDMTFDINGTEYFADTLKFSVESNTAPTWENTDKYVYAELEIRNLSCRYNTRSGYTNTGDTWEITLLSEDTDSVLNNPFSVTDPDKDPKMTEVYNSIIDNLDKLNTENTFGITLLDMDFDGMPEVLHSEIINCREDIYDYQWKTEVDVYRVVDGGLKYIDTIYNAHMVVYSTSNYLGLTTLEDGTKGWFATSYKNRKSGQDNETDYVYKLKGDKLEAIEIFSREIIGEGEDAVEKYYYMGKEIVPEVTIGVDPYYDESWGPEEDFPHEYVSYNGIRATFGMWELFGFLRENFCNENIEESYYLYSNWLGSEGTAEKYELSERDLSYNIAYLVDAFFLGEYDSTTETFIYDFLGDYAKPVIYLYPEEETEVDVKVNFRDGGELTCTYPEYNEGWSVTAMPDGTLFDSENNEYYCLYWEGESESVFSMTEGFSVKGEDTAEFLREKLMYIGLTAREANEFIIYWLPLMEDNEYNVITFHTEEYSAAVPLTVTPAPDTSIRVFMSFYASDEAVDIPEQALPSYERKGFTLVEWGGTALARK